MSVSPALAGASIIVCSVAATASAGDQVVAGLLLGDSVSEGAVAGHASDAVLLAYRSLDSTAHAADTFVDDVLHGGERIDAAIIAELFEATIVFVPPRRAPIGGHAYLRPELGGIVGTRPWLAGVVGVRPRLGGTVGARSGLGGKCQMRAGLGGLVGVSH
jgi:hypothetical protein